MQGRRLLGAGVVMGLLTLAALVVLVAVAKSREASRIAKCGKNVNQLAVAQLNVATNG